MILKYSTHAFMTCITKLTIIVCICTIKYACAVFHESNKHEQEMTPIYLVYI